MRSRLFHALAIFFTASVALSARAEAQVVSVGPYYATPSWDQTFACTVASCPRFVVLTNFNSEAVLDRETGVVWERRPSENIERADFNSCGMRIVGNRQGWRLPTLQELRSLIDPTRTGPSLPDGHPFENIHFHVPDPFGSLDLYWSSTEESLNPGNLVLVNFGIPNGVGGSPASLPFGRSWCVRGGPSAPVQ